MSECDVCVHEEGGDCGPEFYQEKTLKARKQYKCNECRDPILPGSIYVRMVGKWDDEFQTIRTCECCDEIRAVFFCDGWIYGMMWEGMVEQAFPRLTTASKCFTDLSPKSKEFVLQKWRDWKFERD